MSASEIIKAALSLPLEERAEFVLKMFGNDPALLERLLPRIGDPANLPESAESKESGSGRNAFSQNPSRESVLSDDDLVSLWGEASQLNSQGSDEPCEVNPGSLKPRLMVGPYRLLQPLGEGGMGSVWLAEQNEPVKRRVALKVIKNWGNSNDILARFEVERQALAMMNHPHIARILDAGSTPNGQPYFAMELVQGQALTDYCDENRLGLDERLKLFSQVCSGIQHAHQKGVIHRDLKPSNVLVAMVDGKPVVKVIDFGLAKAVESTQKLTDRSLFTGIGQIMGTLKYMSPEQAKLGSMDIDTRTDIYALGVLLYELLTGCTPLEDSVIKEQAVLTILTFIRETDPVKPSSRLSNATHEHLSQVTQKRNIDRSRLSKILTGDLDWIVMKALEKDRTRRYESASAFSEDIIRFMNNEPVVARPPSLNYKLAKFVRKNRTGVVASGLLILSLLGGLFGTGYGFLLASESAEAERIARLDAQDRADEAIQQRTRAELRERQAIEAIESFGDAVRNNIELKNNPSLGPLRKTLLQEPLSFFQSLRERMESDADTSQESLQRLASAADELGILTAEIGDRQNAVQAFEQALEIRERLARENPADEKLQSELAFSLNSVAGLWNETGRSAEAIEVARKAIEAREKLTREYPTQTRYQVDLANSINLVAVLLDRTGNTNEAIQAWQRALKIQERLVQENPTVPDFRKELAGSYNNLGLIFQRTGNPVEALRAYEKALELRERLATEFPSIAKAQHDLAQSYSNLGIFRKETGNYNAALQLYEKATGILERLVNENETVSEFQYALAQSQYNFAIVLGETGKQNEGLQRFEQVLEKFQHLANENPKVTKFQSELAKTYNNIGVLLKDTGKPADALKALQKGVAIQERLSTENPTVSEYQSELARHHESVGRLFSQTEQKNDAVQAYEKALTIRKRLASENPAVVQFQNALAICHNLIGNEQNAIGKFTESIKSLREALEIQERLAIENPSLPELQNVLALSYNNIGSVLSANGQSKESLEAFQQSLEIQKKLARDNPNVPMYQCHVGVTLHNLADTELQSGQYAVAQKHLRLAIEYQQRALTANPADPLFRRYMRQHLATLARVAAAQHEADLAREVKVELSELLLSDPANSKIAEQLATPKEDLANASVGELLGLGQFAYDTMQFSLASHLFDCALKKDTALAEDRQRQIAYNAACCALLAAAGESNGESPLDDAERSELRGQALIWLTAELNRWQEFLDANPERTAPERAAIVRQVLDHWKTDPDLQSVREENQLIDLPESERESWVRLWQQVKEITETANE